MIKAKIIIIMFMLSTISFIVFRTLGGLMCGFGGGCIVRAGCLACSAALASNPVGWAIGGVVICM